MKLELLDQYTIRVRVSSGIILFAPLMVTVFLCLKDIATLASSTVLICILLAFTNYLPMMQRQFWKKKPALTDYATEFLSLDNEALDEHTKHHYYEKLSQLDDSFQALLHPESNREFRLCCSAAVRYLRQRTRNIHIVQEENINYGFCKCLYASKRLGISLCILCNVLLLAYSRICLHTWFNVPVSFYLAFSINSALLFFWIFCVNQDTLKDAGMRYATTLLSQIDILRPLDHE